jgi:hypothetical protein
MRGKDVVAAWEGLSLLCGQPLGSRDLGCEAHDWLVDIRGWCGEGPFLVELSRRGCERWSLIGLGAVLVTKHGRVAGDREMFPLGCIVEICANPSGSTLQGCYPLCAG